MSNLNYAFNKHMLSVSTMMKYMSMPGKHELPIQ